MGKIKVYRKRELRMKKSVPGAQMWALGLENTMLTYFELAPHTSFPEHSHESEQITLVLEGRLVFEFDGRIEALKSGDAIAIPANRPHSCWTESLACKAVDAWSPVREDYL